MNILGIDLGSIQTCAVLTQKTESGLKILGIGKAKTQGVKKGAITNIESAARSIEQAVDNVKMMSGSEKFDKIVVSLSGSYAKAVNSQGVVTVDNEISIKEIHRAVESAKLNANLPTGFDIVHVLPYSFKANDISQVEDPLGMSAKRLEVLAHIVISQDSHIKNLKKAVELMGLRVDNVVLAGYASAIACLDETEKDLGAVLIDMGGAICDIVAHSQNSIQFNDCFAIGSYNITQDLSTALHTPLDEAERIKLSYEDLSQQPENLVKVPAIGNKGKINEYNLETISNVIYARAEETLMILAKMVSDSPVANSVGAGVVLTGGMTKLAGLDKLTTAMFDNKVARVASAREDLISGYSEFYTDPENSCAIGLCLYEAGHFTPYEIDSNRQLRYKGEPEFIEPPKTFTPIGAEDEDIFSNAQESAGISLEIPKKEERGGVFSTIAAKIKKLF